MFGTKLDGTCAESIFISLCSVSFLCSFEAILFQEQELPNVTGSDVVAPCFLSKKFNLGRREFG